MDPNSTKVSDLCARLEAALTEYNAAERAVELHVLPLIRQALKEKCEHLARELARMIPADTVVRAYAMDAFQQAGVPWR